MPGNEIMAVDDLLIHEIDLAIPGFRCDLVLLSP